jgi:spore coat polysaccharide biosynthesis protein SpsF
MRRLVACLACRNNSKRLYGKPLQNLDVQSQLSVLDYIVRSINTFSVVEQIVLAISDGIDNAIYINFAKQNNISYFIGDEEDVLGRLISACELVRGTDIFRITTESPFIYYESIAKAWSEHVNYKNDLTTIKDLPDGSGFEIISLEAYKKSWSLGESRHRSEYCSLYMYENKREFNIQYIKIPKEIQRKDIRLTIDYPEDLILCRFVYSELKKFAPLIPLTEIIKLLDNNIEIKKLVDKYIVDGLKTMYL